MNIYSLVEAVSLVDPDAPIFISEDLHTVDAGKFYPKNIGDTDIIFNVGNCCLFLFDPKAPYGNVTPLSWSEYEIILQHGQCFVVTVENGEIYADVKGTSPFDAQWEALMNKTSVTFADIENLVGVTTVDNNPLTGKEISPKDIVATNRSLVLVYGNQKSTPEFRERAGRLVESLNNADTMKAVVVTVNGSKVYHGLSFKTPDTGDTPDLQVAKNNFIQVIEVKDAHS